MKAVFTLLALATSVLAWYPEYTTSVVYTTTTVCPVTITTTQVCVDTPLLKISFNTNVHQGGHHTVITKLTTSTIVVTDTKVITVTAPDVTK
jgi:hypothetical protein